MAMPLWKLLVAVNHSLCRIRQITCFVFCNRSVTFWSLCVIAGLWCFESWQCSGVDGYQHFGGTCHVHLQETLTQKL